MSDESQDRSGRDVASALASRRPARSSELETRLWAAAARPARPSWIVPVALAAAVAAVAVVVIAMRGERTTPPAEQPDLAAAPTPSPAQQAPAGGPLTPSADVADLLAPYQALLDGDTQNLGLEPAQLARLRDLADDLAKQRATQDAQKAIAMIELRRELDRVDIDPAKAGALSDRVATADAATRRAELIARISARSVLTVKQRTLLGRGQAVAKSPPVALQRTAQPASTGTGTLRIGSKPTTNVSIDGRDVGTTPLTIKLAAGKHRVVLEHDGKRRLSTVTITDGQDQRMLVDLSNDDVIDPFSKRN